jgi:hypothetical protein
MYSTRRVHEGCKVQALGGFEARGGATVMFSCAWWTSYQKMPRMILHSLAVACVREEWWEVG